MSESVKISRDTYAFVKEIASKSGKSIREVIENAVRIAYQGSEDVLEKELKSVKQAFINTRFRTRCSICKREIKEGELVYWIRYEFTDKSVKTKIICLECFYKDKAIAKYYVKKKELEQAVKGLRKEANELAEKVLALRKELAVLDIKKQIYDLLRSFRTSYLSNDAEAIEFLERLNELADKVSALEAKVRMIHRESEVKVITTR